MSLDFNKIREKNGITQSNAINKSTTLNFDEIRAKNGIFTKSVQQVNPTANILRNATKVNTYDDMVQPIFKTKEEALQYAKNNNINVTGIETSPSLSLPENNINLKITTPIPIAEKEPTAFDKFYNNVITPMNEFNSAVFYNTGKGIAKPVYKASKIIGNVVKGEEHPFNKAEQQTNQAFNKLEERMGYNNPTTATKTGEVVGNTLGFLGTANSLGGGPLSYGATSGIQTFGETNDVGDIVVNTGTGIAFGALNKYVTGATNNFILNKVPISNPVTLSTNPTTASSIIQVGANVLRNLISGGTGMYSAGAITSTLKNAYNNLLRGREVKTEDWISPVLGEQAMINFTLGGILNSITGTAKDVKTAKAQAEKYYYQLGNGLKETNIKMQEAFKNGNLAEAKMLYQNGVNAIDTFGKMQFMGKTANTTELSNMWNVMSNASAVHYNPTTITQNTTNGLAPLNANVPTVQANNNTPASVLVSNAVKQATAEVEKMSNITQNQSQNNVQNVQNFENTLKNSNLIKVYHGTNQKFNSYVPSKSGNYGEGIYLTTNPYVADEFKTRKTGDNSGYVYENYADIKNPIYIDEYSDTSIIANELKKYLPETSKLNSYDISMYTSSEKAQITQQILKELSASGISTSKILNDLGYDGIIVRKETIDGIEPFEVVAFSPNQIQNIENSRNISYNATDGGVVNGRTEQQTRSNNNRLGTSEQLFGLVNREGTNIESAVQMLKTTKEINENSLNSTLKQTKNIAKNKYNKNIIYYTNNNSDINGLIDKNGNVYMDYETAQKYGSDFMFGHEIAEDMLTNHTNIVLDDYTDMMNIIKQSPNFTEMFKDFTSTLSSSQKQRMVLNIDKLVKEILCDINGSRKTTQSPKITESLKQNLGIETYNNIATRLEQLENKIYNNTQELAQPSSFSLPTTEQINEIDKKVIEDGANALIKATENKKSTGTPNFMLINEKDTYKRNMFKNNAKAINDLIKAKNTISSELTQKINEKQNLYNSKKDKTTKVAQNLQNQIINLQKRKADIEEKFIKKIDRLENRNANINKLKKQISEDRIPTRKEVKEKIINETDLKSLDLDNIKDVPKWIMNNTIPLRVNEKVFGKETATKINDTFFRPIKHNEAERIRFLNKERLEIKKLGIKPKSEDSALVQMYGEGEFVNEQTGEVSKFTLEDLKKSSPENWENIKKSAEVLRKKYDTYLDIVNKELNKMGYDSIPKLKNYFRHFEEIKSLLDQMGIPTKLDTLPTDMNGLTSDLRPGKNFFANALSRTGKKTTYDAITGIDGYLEGISKLMYHTEDIQKLRTLDEYIRGQYGRNAELERLNKADFQQKVAQIQEGHLSEYASWLTEYTNALAGKKSKMDRGTEEQFGRRIYGTLNALKRQVGSNLTGLNLNSALSNFIPITQGASKTSKLAMFEGLGDTVKNIFVKDNFINESDFLTRRFGSDKLSKTLWENISNAGQILMAGTDWFSANMITRSKYYEYLNKGYSKNEAIKLADEFADRVMGGRALGDMPNIFNSKTLGILTQFQLENVNQFDAMFHDTKYENRADNEKIKSNLAQKNPKLYNGLTATFILGQLFAYAWAYNKIDEELTGSGGAFDIFGIIEDLIKDFTNPNLSKADAIKNLVLNIIDVIPYANILTGGGRVPMTDALPFLNIVDLLEGKSSLGSELWKVPNLLLPTGGGQLKKTIQGAGALIKGGEYKKDSNGKEQLKFKVGADKEAPLGEKLLEGFQALTFGKWATKGGKQYIENGMKGLSAVETEGYKKLRETGMTTDDFYKIRKEIKGIKVPTRTNKEGKEEPIPGQRRRLIIEVLENSNLNEKQKELLYDIYYKKEIK